MGGNGFCLDGLKWSGTLTTTAPTDGHTITAEVAFDGPERRVVVTYPGQSRSVYTLLLVSGADALECVKLDESGPLGRETLVAGPPWSWSWRSVQLPAWVRDGLWAVLWELAASAEPEPDGPPECENCGAPALWTGPDWADPDEWDSLPYCSGRCCCEGEGEHDWDEDGRGDGAQCLTCGAWSHNTITYPEEV